MVKFHGGLDILWKIEIELGIAIGMLVMWYMINLEMFRSNLLYLLERFSGFVGVNALHCMSWSNEE